jgi:hypothetical protein
LPPYCAVMLLVVDLPGLGRRSQLGKDMRSTTDSGAADTLTGYAHPRYADSLAEFGVPRRLPRCKGWILQRPIPGFAYHDGMGCYPLFSCQNWSQIPFDLEDLSPELVALSLVADPFGEYDPRNLRGCLDVLIPFKEHHVVDLDLNMNSFVSNHHRRYARKALREVHVERCHSPAQLVDEWVDLYTTLVKRHGIKGIPAFSKTSLAKQLKVPGMVMFRAVHKETTIGLILWYVLGDVAHYHLGAYSDAGYQLRASFALFWFAIEYFASNGLRWLNLGASAGTAKKGSDGLSRFKQGWSTGTRTAYFCGRVLNQEKYSEILNARGRSETDYFPAYRKGEFG